MQVGDVVISRNGPFSTAAGCLRSGCEAYTHAICVSVEPFVLVSEEGDMRWSSQRREDFVALCQADLNIRVRAFKRYERDQSSVSATGGINSSDN